MYIEKIEFDNVRYNPELSAFETLVKVNDGGQAYSYPVHVAAPLHAEYGILARSLAQAGRKAHASANPGIRLAHAADSAETTPQGPPPVSMLDRLLGRHAA